MRCCFPKTSQGEFHACSRLSLYNLAEMFGVLYKLSRGLDVMLATGCFLLAFLLVLPQIITTVKIAVAIKINPFDSILLDRPFFTRIVKTSAMTSYRST